MFWVWWPYLSGTWKGDKEWFTGDIYKDRRKWDKKHPTDIMGVYEP